MKHIILIPLVMLSFCSPSYGQEANHPGISFDTLSYDFGLLKKGSDAVCHFSFVNRDEAPVIITNVKTSCGCAVPEWPREPYLPGTSGSITVEYNTRIIGTFQKTISVYTNRNAQAVELTIKGAVQKKSAAKNR